MKWNIRISTTTLLLIVAAVLISTGLAARIAFRIYFREAGRFEMGQLAMFELSVYGIGLLLVSISLALPANDKYRKVGCAALFLAALVLMLLVLDSMPP